MRGVHPLTGVVGSDPFGRADPGRDLAWVFARQPQIDEALYQDLLRRMAGHGVDTAKLVRVPQVPEQEGQPGYAEAEKPRAR